MSAHWTCCCDGGGSTPVCCPTDSYTWASTVCSMRFDGAAPNQLNNAISTGNYILGTIATVSVNPSLLSARTIVKVGLTGATTPQCAYGMRTPNPNFCQPATWAVGTPFVNGTAYMYQGTDRIPVSEYIMYHWVTPWNELGVAKWEIGITLTLKFINPLSSTSITFATVSHGAVSGTIINSNSCPTGLTFNNTLSCGRTTQTLQRGHARVHIDQFSFCSPPLNALPGFHPYSNVNFFCPVESTFVGTIT